MSPVGELPEEIVARLHQDSTTGGRIMQSSIFKITGLKDEHCVRTLANAIQDLPNIGQIEISLEKGEACIEHGRFVSPDDILEAIVDSGFEAELIS
ncbi:MAG: heavy metal-associated domain-containing protein [Azonexus sp.]|nr:heavy metal-associated domain-containing protein [Azonexus sp.]